MYIEVLLQELLLMCCSCVLSFFQYLLQEILERFTAQKETHQHLLKLKEDNEKLLQQLREQKELLNKELQDVKYSGEAQVSR